MCSPAWATTRLRTSTQPLHHSLTNWLTFWLTCWRGSVLPRLSNDQTLDLAPTPSPLPNKLTDFLTNLLEGEYSPLPEQRPDSRPRPASPSPLPLQCTPLHLTDGRGLPRMKVMNRGFYKEQDLPKRKTIDRNVHWLIDSLSFECFSISPEEKIRIRIRQNRYIKR